MINLSNFRSTMEYPILTHTHHVRSESDALELDIYKYRWWILLVLYSCVIGIFNYWLTLLILDHQWWFPMILANHHQSTKIYHESLTTQRFIIDISPCPRMSTGVQGRPGRKAWAPNPCGASWMPVAGSRCWMQLNPGVRWREDYDWSWLIMFDECVLLMIIYDSLLMIIAEYCWVLMSIVDYWWVLMIIVDYWWWLRMTVYCRWWLLTVSFAVRSPMFVFN